MNKLRIITMASLGLVLCIAIGTLAFDADFDPSTYNPMAAELVNFEVCQPCLGGSDFDYRWDFDGNGEVETETEDDLVTYAFASDGFYEVILTVLDAGGRTSVSRQGIFVGTTPAFATRELLREDDGSIFVLITITMNRSATSIGLEENMPQGWQVEVVDPSGAMYKPNTEERQIEAIWASAFDEGDVITFSYRLHPAYTSTLPKLFGELSGYAAGNRFVAGVTGHLTLP